MGDYPVLMLLVNWGRCEPPSPTRNAEISQMMDYAFANYKSEALYQKG